MGRSLGSSTAGRAILIAGITGLLRTVVALLLRTVVAFATTATGLTLPTAAIRARGVATGVGSGVQHRNFAPALGAEHRALAAEGRLGTGGCRSLGGFGDGNVAFIREGRRFPALGRVFHFRGRKDVELGLGGGSSGFDDGRDGRGRSGGSRCLRGLGNNVSNRGRGDGSRGDHGNGRSFVHRGERVLVFRLRLKHLHGGGFVGAGDGVVAGGGRSGRSADAFAAREARAAIGAGSGTPIGGGRCGRTGGRGRGLGRRAAGRGCI